MLSASSTSKRLLPNINPSLCSNDLTDRHTADKVLADKALGRVFARNSTLSERTAAIVWTAMKAKTKIDMKPGDETKKEDDEEKGDEKADTSDGETRRYVTVSANVGRARALRSAERSAWRKR
ncbi:hypothetical protein G5I_05866 [Acromyrmex echinatior]|uniref:Uncharacterized protein n=1 Tax=Acromyrmex echinatior TaxID=103372 RepID=F4WJI7_ACREC|nr:hypothetical protein G5I_05866 [Acromyrmex echinatior]